jgi:hypothetical protein
MASAFLIVESDWKATNTPSTPTISPNASNQNFEIDIKLKIVQKSDNKHSGVDITPRARGQAL